MARTPATLYICDACQGQASKWQGQCPHCGEWNTLGAQSAAAARPGRGARAAALVAATAAAPLATAMESAIEGELRRLSLGMAELDRVLGGGLVPGSVTLLGGEPGIGKSTLLLQVAGALEAGPRRTAPAGGSTAAARQGVLYATGEESAHQVALRARRLGAGFGQVHVLAETDLDSILALAESRRPALLLVDSIQTMQLAAVTNAAGAVTQLRECTAALVRFAKGSGTAVFIVGHVTKDGAIAGPRLLEHLVDTVLYFERDAGSRFRRVRAAKNRFGAANELGFFLMQESGLKEVKNPAAIFLARAPQPVAGSIVMVTRDGTRPLLVEVQGLVDPSRFGAPRRVAQGIETGRLAMLLAVLHRHAGVALLEHDVFANVVGGLSIEEPAADLPVALALASSLRDVALAADLVAFGEVGLTGEVRPVAFGEERIREAAKLGFRRALVPEANVPRAPMEGIEVIGVARIEDALRRVLGGAPV